MTERVDAAWAQSELIPFLSTVFGSRNGYENKSRADWEQDIRRAEVNINNIRFYEDFPATIESLRLSLINPALLTAAETKQFAPVRANVQLCVEIFVRHAIRHEVYPLFSLGCAPCREFPREDIVKAQKENSELLSADDTMQWSPPAQGGDNWGVGGKTSLPYAPTKKGRAKGKKSKPRGHRQTGLGEPGSARLPGPASSGSGYENMLGRLPPYNGAYNFSSAYDNSQSLEGSFCGTPSAVGALNAGTANYRQDSYAGHHPGQFGVASAQQPYHEWGVDASTGLYNKPLYASPYADISAGPVLYHDPSHQFEFAPAAGIPDPQVSVAPLGGHASAFQPGATSYRLRAEADDFLPGAASQGI